jgi:hypothetical protein
MRPGPPIAAGIDRPERAPERIPGAASTRDFVAHRNNASRTAGMSGPAADAMPYAEPP